MTAGMVLICISVGFSNPDSSRARRISGEKENPEKPVVGGFFS